MDVCGAAKAEAKAEAARQARTTRSRPARSATTPPEVDHARASVAPAPTMLARRSPSARTMTSTCVAESRRCTEVDRTEAASSSVGGSAVPASSSASNGRPSARAKLWRTRTEGVVGPSKVRTLLPLPGVDADGGVVVAAPAAAAVATIVEPGEVGVVAPTAADGSGVGDEGVLASAAGRIEERIARRTASRVTACRVAALTDAAFETTDPSSASAGSTSAASRASKD